MKKILLVCGLLSTLTAIAAGSYSERFIKSFSACEPVTETTMLKDANGTQIPLTKSVQGVMNHQCIYKQVAIRPAVRDITTCSLSKPMVEEISAAMKNEDGQLYNVELTIKGENIRLNGLTKSEIIWTQYLNEESICKRELITR